MYGAQRKTVILVCKFLFRIQILFAHPMLLLVHRSIVLKILLLFFYLLIFNDKKSLDVIILPIIWFLKLSLLPRLHLVFLPTILASLPPRVMLLNRSTAPRDSTTDIEKTSRKGAAERKRPSRSVAKMVKRGSKINYSFLGVFFKKIVE